MGYYVVGIIGGAIWTEGLHRSFFMVIILTILSWSLIYILTKSGRVGWLICCMLLGIIRFLSHPVVTEQSYLKDYVTLTGTIVSLKKGAYEEQMVLDSVSVERQSESITLHSKVKVCYDQPQAIACGNQVTLVGKVKPPSKVYNPSDMNYESYLKSQGIICEVELINIKKVVPRTTFIHALRQSLKIQIYTVFEGKDKGMIQALVLGDKEELDKEVKSLYSVLGIGHLIALSGLHLGIISMCCWFVLGRMGLNYSRRSQVTILCIWCYWLLAGGSVSMMRACVMMSLVLGIRSFWEEEDLMTNCALAAGVVLIANPFELYQVGFQLSFMAIIGVIGVGLTYRYMKRVLKWPKHVLRICRVLAPTVMLTLVLSPILAYHFYEVPLLGIVLNLIVIPLFSMLLPIIFLIILSSYVVPGISHFFAQSVLGIFNGVEEVGRQLAQLPFATYICGRPTVASLIFYYGGIAIFMLWMYQQERETLKKEQILVQPWFVKVYGSYGIFLGSICIGCALLFFNPMPKGLEVMHLYVGQGDCCVIRTREGKTILMDAGTERAGETILRYLKYKGVRRVDLVVISHPHEDHVGGLFKLMDEGMGIDQVVWADMQEEDVYRTRLIESCQQLRIPLISLYKEDCIQIGDLQLDVLWPKENQSFSNPNEGSLVSLLTYKEVTELFTGDIGIETEARLVQDLEDIDILKVGHHGSKDSSSYKFLDKINAEYGMISSGVNNRYGHPHPLALERLNEYEMSIHSTSEQGAIQILMDGFTYRVENQLQEER